MVITAICLFLAIFLVLHMLLCYGIFMLITYIANYSTVKGLRSSLQVHREGGIKDVDTSGV